MKQPDVFSSIRGLIKRKLQEKEMSYASLAKKLGVSEVTVKRWMTSQEMRLSDLEKIGKILDFTTRSPILEPSPESPIQQEYTLAQEKYFAENPLAASLFLKLFIGFDFEMAVRMAGLPKSKAYLYLREMEKHEILSLQPNDIVKVKIKGPFKWKKNGPMVKAYVDLFRQTIYGNLEKKFPPPSMRSIPKKSRFYLPFETYMTKKTADEFSKELLEVFHRYRTFANAEFREKLPVVPVSGILAVDFFDAWTQVFKSSANNSTISPKNS